MTARGFTTFLLKEALLERRQRTTLGGILVYVLGLVFLAGLVLHGSLSEKAGVVLFWLLLTFSAIGALTRAFVAESPGQLALLYQWGSAGELLLAKLCYNTAVVLVYSVPAALLYSTLVGLSVADVPLFGLGLVVGAVGLAGPLTLTSALVARAGGQYTLMAVLSLPLLVPQVLTLIRIAEGAVLGVDRWAAVGISLGLSTVSVALGLVLFPLLWRE